MKLTILSKQGIYSLCRCECGTEKLILTFNINSGKTKSCGCLRASRNKLTAEQIPEIRKLCKQGEKHEWIGAKFGITASTVSKIGNGVIWGRVSQ